MFIKKLTMIMLDFVYLEKSPLKYANSLCRIKDKVLL